MIRATRIPTLRQPRKNLMRPQQQLLRKLPLLLLQMRRARMLQKGKRRVKEKRRRRPLRKSRNSQFSMRTSVASRSISLVRMVKYAKARHLSIIAICQREPGELEFARTAKYMAMIKS